MKFNLTQGINMLESTGGKSQTPTLETVFNKIEHGKTSKLLLNTQECTNKPNDRFLKK